VQIAVTIACARADAPLAQTLDAVLTQTGIVTVALATESLALESLALEHGARVVDARGPGIAAARNAALATCGEPVLVLLDDDACPQDGWLEAHARQWREPASDLAIVGGPIAPRVIGRRPGWLDDELLGVFGLVDHGAPSRRIDGTATRLLGGNMSMRVDVAAGLGGFWPMRGHPDLRGWYDSEALLQREAAEAGWHLHWAEDAAVDRLVDGSVTRRMLLARRGRHGALVGAVGNSRRATYAGRQALTSLLGTPVALISGSQTRAVGRLARTVENVAVLTGKRTASAMLTPTGPTEFRPAVAMPATPPPRQSLRGGSAIVLLYHRVDDSDDPLGLCVSQKNFGEHMRVLRGRTVVPLHELAAAVSRGRVPPRRRFDQLRRRLPRQPRQRRADAPSRRPAGHGLRHHQLPSRRARRSPGTSSPTPCSGPERAPRR